MSTEQMTSRERLMTTIAGGIPDRVPIIPDFSNMIPAKMTGRPFWDIYLHGNPSLYIAYVKAAQYYGIDGWYQAYDAVTFNRKNQPTVTQQTISQNSERIVVRHTYDTACGSLGDETTYYVADPPTVSVKRVKDLQADFAKVKCFYGDIESYDASKLPEYRKMCGENGIFTLGVGYPGMHDWIGWFAGGLEAAVYAYYDHPVIFDEWADIMEKSTLQQAEILLSLKPDVLLLGGSGTVTLSNPELVRKYSLPTIQKVCKMAKEAGILTMLHSCGKTMAMMDMLVNETELDCINPLEAPPMGDVDLKEVKRLYGDKICLMGNLHTTEVMLYGTVDDVERAAKKAIDDAGAGGGFLLSTGDQCGRDTPVENLFNLVEVAKTYGAYR